MFLGPRDEKINYFSNPALEINKSARCEIESIALFIIEYTVYKL